MPLFGPVLKKFEKWADLRKQYNQALHEISVSVRQGWSSGHQSHRVVQACEASGWLTDPMKLAFLLGREEAVECTEPDYGSLRTQGLQRMKGDVERILRRQSPAQGL